MPGTEIVPYGLGCPKGVGHTFVLHRGFVGPFDAPATFLIEHRYSGSLLRVNGQPRVMVDGKPVRIFVKQLPNPFENQAWKGFRLKTVPVNGPFYSQKEGGKHETLLVLPELLF
jgi:hypothetical protein